MTSANSAIASVRAKPSSTLPNNFGAAARSGDIIAEDDADTDARAGDADGGEAATNEFAKHCC